MSQMENQIQWDETVLPFQLDRSDIRGRITRLDATLKEVLRQHDYPTDVSGLVAEAVAITALIGQSIKLRWKLSLQIRGDGPIRIIATDYYGPGENGEPARMRAYASYDADEVAASEAPAFEKIGKGMFAILIDQGPDMQPYQGITPLAGGSLSHCAETYFAQSEQLPTKFEIQVAETTEPGQRPHWRAGGVMLQHLAKSGQAQAHSDTPLSDDGVLAAGDLLQGDAEENWTRAVTLLETVELTELIGPLVTPPQLLLRLFHEEIPRIYDPQTIRFGCSCSEDKVRQSLSIYSAKDISTMTNEDNRVTADCQFCGAHYDLDPASVGFEAE
jgi:molecular chaperone Hsp33